MGHQVTWLLSSAIFWSYSLSSALLPALHPGPFHTSVFWGKGQSPLYTEQPAAAVLHSRGMANRLFSLLQQPCKDGVKQMAACLMNSQQLSEPVCQLGLCSACVSHVCQSWAFQLEPVLLLGSPREDEGPLPSLPKLWSLRSAFAQISSSLRAARLSAGPVCVCVWLGFTLCYVISLNLQVRQIFYSK